MCPVMAPSLWDTKNLEVWSQTAPALLTFVTKPARKNGESPDPAPQRVTFTLFSFLTSAQQGEQASSALRKYS
jgi:hypothetical protein